MRGCTRTSKFRVCAGSCIQGGTPGISAITAMTMGTDNTCSGSCSCDSMWVGGGGRWGGEGRGGAGGGSGHGRGERVMEDGRKATTSCRG